MFRLGLVWQEKANDQQRPGSAAEVTGIEIAVR